MVINEEKSTNMSTFSNSLFTNKHGCMTTKEWECLQPENWANDDVVAWCAR
jgi:hypothetical protein